MISPSPTAQQRWPCLEKPQRSTPLPGGLLTDWPFFDADLWKSLLHGLHPTLGQRKLACKDAEGAEAQVGRNGEGVGRVGGVLMKTERDRGGELLVHLPVSLFQVKPLATVTRVKL